MPLTWYQLGSGPAPWADATSYSSTSQSDYSYTISGTNSTGGVTQTGIFASQEARTVATSAKGTGAFDAGSSAVATTTQSALNGYTVGLASTAGTNFVSTGISQVNDSGAGTSRTYISEQGGATNHGITNTASGVGVVFQDGYTITRNSEVVSSQAISGNVLNYSESSSFTRSTHRTIYYGGTTNSSTSEGTTQFSSGSFSTSYTLATVAVVTGYTVSSTSTFKHLSTTRTSASLLTVSTSSSSSVGTTTTSYGTTRTSSSSYTRATSTNVSTTGSFYQSLTSSYMTSTGHLATVVSATGNEYLRLITATGTGLVDLSAILGASFVQSTFSSAASSGVQGSPFADSTITRTITSASFTYATITITTAGFTNATVTEADFDGRLPTPGTATVERYLSGPTTATATARTGATVTATSTLTAALSFVSYQLLDYTSVSSETITGLLANGSTTAIGIQRTYSVPVWTTFQAWSGKAGDTVTTFRSPASTLAVAGGGGLDVTRMEREGGFQAPTAMGSAGAQGGGLTANSSFVIDPAAIGTASPASLRTPFLTAESTAVSGASSYTYTLGSNGVWSVTAASTTTSTSFTATVGTASAGEHFNQASPAGVTTNSVTVAGGAHARTGADQHATLNGGHGWRYTVGDGAGTTSSKVILTATYATAALGSSIIAAETFRAGLASPATKTGTPTFYNAAYSAP